MELTDETLAIHRERSDLDDAVLSFTAVLDSCDVEYVIVSGYVAILTGRSRGTEDVDVVLEPLENDRTERLVSALEDAGYWGMAMPLDETYSMLSAGDRIRVAEEGAVFPNFECWFASSPVEQEAVEQSLTAAFDDGHSIEISPIELQIAYKLRLAERAGSLKGKDFEDALHLYLTFEGRFNTEELEVYVNQLGCQDYYDELQRV